MIKVYIKDDAPEGMYEIRYENEDSTSIDNQLSDSLGSTLIIPVLMDGQVEVINTTGVSSEPVLPGTFELLQNYPNPFNSRTVISFTLPTPGDVELTVYDLLGRKVATLYSGALNAGRTDISWNARTSAGEILASGVYYYRLAVKNGVSFTRRMTLLK
jgi:hypothetical protein